MNMMRYQRLSPECLPISNGRKSHHAHNSSLRPTSITSSSSTHHHHHHHNQNIYGSSSRNGNSIFDNTKSSQRFRPSPSILPTPPPVRHLPQSVRIPILPDPTNHSHHEGNGVSRCETSGSPNLLQWGHNKKSRGSRAENRYVVGDDSSASSASKIQRRSITGMLDRHPSHNNNNNNNIRGSNLRSCNTVSRDSFPDASANSRKAEEGQQPGKGPPVRSEKRHHHHPHPKPTEEKEKEKMQKQCSTTSHYQQNQHPFSASGDVLKRSCVASSEKEVAGSGMACGASEKLNLELFEWPRIYLSLSRKEKEDDFLIMKGTKLSQRPKKRPKNIDRTLQYCYPGTWLSDLTRSRYEVREKKCVKKKKRGLKGMENMDSDSD